MVDKFQRRTNFIWVWLWGLLYLCVSYIVIKIYGNFFPRSCFLLFHFWCSLISPPVARASHIVDQGKKAFILGNKCQSHRHYTHTSNKDKGFTHLYMLAFPYFRYITQNCVLHNSSFQELCVLVRRHFSSGKEWNFSRKR